ncbi:MAG: hypothetical protein ACK5HS_02490 [Mycoplasmatales bacterium]
MKNIYQKDLTKEIIPLTIKTIDNQGINCIDAQSNNVIITNKEISRIDSQRVKQELSPGMIIYAINNQGNYSLKEYHFIKDSLLKKLDFVETGSGFGSLLFHKNKLIGELDD